MPDETYVPNPAQPEGPQISAPIASELGNAMMQGAGDAVRAASLAREAEQAEQLAKPLQEGAITGIPSEISTTIPDTEPPIPTTTVRPTTTTTTVPITTTPTTPPTTTKPSTKPPVVY